MGSGGDDPAFLCVGTEVSAKYRGAFCEAKVKSLVKKVKCKIFIKELQSSLLVTDDAISKGNLKVNATVEVKHPESGNIVEGTVLKLTDHSTYTVVFNDGDERTLRRTQLCLKGEKHFMESETLDNLPLSHPEHFGTPVMSSKKSRRSKGNSGDEVEDEDDEDDEDSDDSCPKRAEYKSGRLRSLVGRIMVMEQGEKKKLQVPVLVCLPDASTATDRRTKEHLLVKSFKDGKFFAALRKDLKEFSKDLAQKNEEKVLKMAYDKALCYHDSEDLPASWERDELLGTDGEDDPDEEESSDDEPSEEKDLFLAQLIKFMEERGTPINKAPSISNKDLNLYRLFNVVQNLGGYNKATKEQKWKLVYNRMGLPHSNSAAHQIKNSYKKYLHAFEDFYRKLGSSMGTISRPGRNRNHSGRGIMGFKKDVDTAKKESTKETETKKEDISLNEDTMDVDDSATSKHDKSPPKRATRQDQGTSVSSIKEEKTKKEEEKKTEKEEEKKPAKKETNIKKEEVSKKLTPKAIKKEKDVSVPSPSSRSNKDPEEEVDGQRKIIRRRSMRKEDCKDADSKSEAGEDQPSADNSKKTPVDNKGEKDKEKAKAKVIAKEEKKEKKAAEDKKDESKKVVTRKDMKKVEEEADLKPRKVKKLKEEETPGKTPVRKEKKEDKGEVKSSKKPVGRQPGKTEEEESDVESVHSSSAHSSSSSEHTCGTRLQVRYGKGKNQKIYEAKVIESGKEGSHLQYLVHYAGWNTRYDEWIKPERIVSVINRPEQPEKTKKLTPTNKKKSRPPSGAASSPKSTPSASTESSPRPTFSSYDSPPASASPSLPHSQVRVAKLLMSSGKLKSRHTRSNSTELKMEALPPKVRRSRRNSGLTESSDMTSQASESDNYDQSDGEEYADPQGMVPSPVSENLEKSASTSVNNEKDEERVSNTSSPEMPDLECKVPLEEMSHKGDDSENLNNEDTNTMEISGKEEPACKLELSAPTLDVAAALPSGLPTDGLDKDDTKDSSMDSNSTFKWDLDEDESQKSTLEEIEAEKEHAEEEKEVELKAEDNKESEAPKGIKKETVPMDEPQLEVKNEPTKKLKGTEKEKVKSSECDMFEFRDEEETVSFPDLRAEAEKELKERQKQEHSEGEKSEKRTPRGKKRELKAEKKEVKKEPQKRGKMTMAERKLMPEGIEELTHEPLAKKAKEESHDQISSQVSSRHSTIDEAIDSVCDWNREMMEQNENEKKKLKKKVKKKQEPPDLTEAKTEVKKEVTPKGPRTPKSVKGKTKKKITDVDSQVHSLSPSIPPGQDTGIRDTIEAPKSDCNKGILPSMDPSSTLSAMDMLSGVAMMTEHAIINKSQSSTGKAEEISGDNTTVLVNTPPTTPEHEGMDNAPSTSQDHSMSSNDMVMKHTGVELALGSTGEHYSNRLESLTGNTSPSSNDGSEGSGNVACSESSNGDVASTPVSHNTVKRKRDGEEASPIKKKRKSKSKTGERKSARLVTVGSDSDETNMERKVGELASALRLSDPDRLPKYDLNLEEGKYLEGDDRIAFLTSKLQEIRKIYMQLKSEVACIDRRRKRARRRDKEKGKDNIYPSITDTELNR